MPQREKPNKTESDVSEPDEMHTKDSENGDASNVVLDERIQAQLGLQLSSFYKELVDQPIPQKFMDLLAQLDSKEDKE